MKTKQEYPGTITILGPMSVTSMRNYEGEIYGWQFECYECGHHSRYTFTHFGDAAESAAHTAHAMHKHYDSRHRVIARY